MPERIQLSRRAGWRLPLNAKSVARPHKWGNPFTIAGALESGFAKDKEDAQSFVVEVYRDWLTRGEQGEWWFSNGASAWEYQVNHIAELRGFDLACWCRIGDPCHASVLLEIANR